MDNFKPEEFNWITFRNTGSALDLSNMHIRNEEEILKKLQSLSHLLYGVKALSLAENNLTTVPFISLGLVRGIKYLNLEENNFFVNYNLVQKEDDDALIGWARFPKMKLLEVLNVANCNIQYILPLMFVNLPNLRTLNLAKNYIIKIPESVFSNMPNLINLDLSSMNMNINNDEFLSFESYIELMEIGGIAIDEFTFKNLTKLEYINLSRTRISAKTKAFHHFGKNLKYLGLCLSSIQMLDNQMFVKESLKVLDLSGNPYVAINLNNNSFKGLEKSLKVLWLAESAVKKIYWLEKFKNLEYLNLAVNNINSLTNETFITMTKLKYLDLSANHIGNWYYQIFKNNNLLKILNLQENNINMITPEMYKDFKKMDFMALSKNNFVCKCYLRSLIDHAEQNGNKKGEDFINYLHDRQSIAIFDQLMNRVLIEQYYHQYVQSQKNLKNSTSIENFNSPEFNHDHVYSFQLLDYNEEDYWCYSGTKYLKLNDISFCKSGSNSHTDELNETAKILICGFVVFVVVSTIFAIGYFKKEKIKKIIHKIKKYFGMITGQDFVLDSSPGNAYNNGESYKYDVFVSYSDHDRDWILEELIPNMDTDKELKICLHEREFKVGLTIWENIIFHMDKSRSLLLVISNNFLQSNWCQFEMQFAQKRIFDPKSNPLVLVLLEDIPNNTRPKALQHLMDLRTYIKWPNTTNDSKKNAELKEIFWKRIKKSLKND